MTALTTIDLHLNCDCGGIDEQLFKITSPLLPILHPGLLLLDLRQSRHNETHQEVSAPFKWDPVSLFHLGQAVITVADRRPHPTVIFNR
jgi:hypothetical protein